jgi:hypothetical protein
MESTLLGAHPNNCAIYRAIFEGPYIVSRHAVSRLALIEALGTGKLYVLMHGGNISGSGVSCSQQHLYACAVHLSAMHVLHSSLDVLQRSPATRIG